jgi:hypothetical protein
MSLFHRRSHDEAPAPTVPEPPAAPAPAPPPSPAELDPVVAMMRLKDQLDAGDMTQAEFEARKQQLQGEAERQTSSKSA